MTQILKHGFLLAALALALAGCQPSHLEGTKESGKTVVVDLEAVAKAMGWDVLIAKKVEAATQNLNAQLLQAADNMDKDLKKQQSELGATPTQEQLVEFQKAKARVQQTIQNNKSVAEQAREGVRAQQILRFRTEVKPVAARIAQRHSAEVVLIANLDVVWFASSADITGEVIATLRAKAAAVPPEEAAPPSRSPETNKITSTNSPPTSP
jgi:Skp family chaperone for outer membrane proteins